MKKTKKTCQICGKTFEVYPYRKYTAKYCSKECAAKATWKSDDWRGVKKGSHLSEEHKRKIGKANSGKNNGMYGKHPKFSDEHRQRLSESLKGKSSWNKGKHLSEEHKGKIGDANKGKRRSEETKRKIGKARMGRKMSEATKRKISEANRGEKCYLWRGGKSFEPYSSEFNNNLKKQIRERDNRTCQECHQTEEELGYRLDCHHIDYDKENNNPSNLISLCRSCHAQTNFNREDWTEYYQNRVD